MKALSALIASVLACSFAFGDDRPNIIYIMADDMGYGDLGCYGQKMIQTPNIDRLASEGMRFTQFYSGCTVCAPARCCLMTGMNTGHSWVRDNMSDILQRVPLRPEDFTVAELLQKAGYVTGMIGKWGLGEPDTTGLPNKKGFDYWFGYLNQAHAHSYYPDYLWKNQDKYTLEGNSNGQGKQYSHDLFTKEALAFVERNKDKPFFLYLPYTIPHGKLEIPSDAPYSDRDWPQPCKNYAAMITRLDGDVGKLMKLLKDLGLDEKTIVFFCSDNGAPGGSGTLKQFSSNGPLRGTKGDLYEGGIRVPMIARWPGKIKAGTVSGQVWAMWDFLPTAAEIVGVPPPSKIDGISMLPALLGKPQKQHEFMYWEFHQNKLIQAVRMGDWKAIKQKGKKIELYNLKSDIGEKDDVATQHPDVVARIEVYLKTARTESKYWPTK
jgi:arylsulfatase A